MVGHHDHMFKVLIIGDATVGKTSLVQRYANDSFNKHYKSTVGGEFSGFFSGLHKEITETPKIFEEEVVAEKGFNVQGCSCALNTSLIAKICLMKRFALKLYCKRSYP